MSIYLPYYTPNKKFMQTSIAKLVDMIKVRFKTTFFNFFSCIQCASYFYFESKQTEAIQEAAKIVTCHADSANCSPEEISEQAKKAEQIYENTMHTNINEKWNLTEVLTIKLNASKFR